MRIAEGFIIREIARETIVVPSGEASRLLSGVITLNECGRFIFERLRNEQSMDDLISALLEEYEIDREQASADVEEFLSQLREYGFLLES